MYRTKGPAGYSGCEADFVASQQLFTETLKKNKSEHFLPLCLFHITLTRVSQRAWGKRMFQLSTFSSLPLACSRRSDSGGRTAE